jgi:hypothetical protein
MSENKITFPVKLASNNPQSFGIVDATEISGHRSVATLSDLYSISDPVLSVLKDGSDAIGQEWFVVSEDCKYRLDNWANRKSVAGWTKLPKQELVNTKQSVSEKDQPNGYAGLDSNGKLPIEKTYGITATVTDVATYESLPATGLSGVIYYVSNTGAQYKWSGSAYIDITNGADNAKKNETSIFDCSNGTSTKYYSSLSDAINIVPPVYRTSNRIISYLSTENATTKAVNYQYHGIDSTTWTDLTKWERVPNQSDLAEIRSALAPTYIVEKTRLKSDGTITGSIAGFNTTKYLPVEEGLVIPCAYAQSSNGVAVCFYDENYQFINGNITIESTQNVTANSSNIPENAKYFRATVINNATIGEFLQPDVLAANSPQYGDNLKNGDLVYFEDSSIKGAGIKKKTLEATGLLISGYYLKNGYLNSTTLSGFNVTPFIKVNEGIIVNCINVASANGQAVFFYDKDFLYISAITISSNEKVVLNSSNIPSNAKF